jgi:hypothetical protein
VVVKGRSILITIDNFGYFSSKKLNQKSVNPALRRLRQKDLMFEASLSYIIRLS